VRARAHLGGHPIRWWLTLQLAAITLCACSTADSPADPSVSPTVPNALGATSNVAEPAAPSQPRARNATPGAAPSVEDDDRPEGAEGPDDLPDTLGDTQDADALTDQANAGPTDPATDSVTDAAPPEADAETQREVNALLAKVGDNDPTPVPTLPRAKWFRHKLAPRERVSQVAYRYGVELASLRQWNDLPAQSKRLRIGSRLRVHASRMPPHRQRVQYTVVEGDTWWSVALRHGVDGRDLRAYNYPSRRKMKPGTELRVWVDPVVFDWIEAGGDPLPDDEAFALRRGGVGVGSPNNGTLLNGVRIPKSEAYNLRLPKSAYGTSHAVAHLLVGLTTFGNRSDYPLELQLGAMSRPRGGALKGHKSHQTGRDLDIRLPRKVGVAQWRELTRRRVDWLATWALIDALLQTDVRAIFLDYTAQKYVFRTAEAAGIDRARLREVLQFPGGKAASGIVRHSPGHEKHLHVRFGCGPYEVECVD